LPRPTKNLVDPHWNDASFLLALERFGYDVTDRRSSRPRLPAPLPSRILIDGIVDGESRAILLALLLPSPDGGLRLSP
jgi:N-acetylmuramoyl-L-alanine amidase